MSADVTVIIFYGDHAASEPEQLMNGAWLACAQDTVELALGCPLVEQVIVQTNSEALTAALAGTERVAIERDPPGEPFHFGNLLLRIVEKYGVRRPLYLGAAAAPLLSSASLESICRRLVEVESTVVTNNQVSADLFGFVPADALRRIRLPDAQDNAVPRLLSRQAGLELEVLPRALETSFDVDTPTDVLVLGVQTTIKRHAKGYVESTRLDTSRLDRAMPQLVARDTRKTLIGRVSLDLWGTSALGMRGPRRIYYEESAFKSYGRHLRGEVRTLLGDLYREIGATAFFAKLAEYSDVVIFDSRPMLYHLCPAISPADRFNSDLGNAGAIEDPTGREFTAAALECEVPVLLGGHNIVAGALWALVQESWDRLDAGLLERIPDFPD